MQSQVEIINLALAKLSDGNPVQNLAENSPEAMQAKAHYDVCVKMALDVHPWDFAKKAARLPLLTEDTALTGWAYHYSYPADCVKVCRVYSVSNAFVSPPFLTGRSTKDNQRIIMTNQKNAVAEYIIDNPPVVHMPPHFIDALAWLLATQIAMSTGRANAGNLLQAYQMQIEAARLQDSREAGPRSRADGYWVQNRNAMPMQQQQTGNREG